MTTSAPKQLMSVGFAVILHGCGQTAAGDVDAPTTEDSASTADAACREVSVDPSDADARTLCTTNDECRPDQYCAGWNCGCPGVCSSRSYNCGVSGVGPFCGCDGRWYADPCYAVYARVRPVGVDCSGDAIATFGDD